MNISEPAAVTATLFLLRLGLPLMVTLIFGHGMNRLVDRWNTDIDH